MDPLPQLVAQLVGQADGDAPFDIRHLMISGREILHLDDPMGPPTPVVISLVEVVCTGASQLVIVLLHRGPICFGEDVCVGGSGSG